MSETSELRDQIAAVVVKLNAEPNLCRHDDSGGDCSDLGPEHHWEFAYADAVMAVVGPELEQLRQSRDALSATVHAFPDANNAANIAHARRQRDELRRIADRAAIKRDDYRDRLRQAEAAIERVRAAHSRIDVNGPPVCGHCCDSWGEPRGWPCPTIKALSPAPEHPTAASDPTHDTPG